MVARSAAVGRSTKKFSSNLPRRLNSLGNAVTSLAVATTNTPPSDSDINVRMVPKMRWDTPELSAVPDSALSTSSNHKTQGLIASAVLRARRILPSDSPTNEPSILATSSFSSGKFRIEATFLASKLLPVPGGPASNTPFGSGRLLALASSVNNRRRRSSQSRNRSRPPKGVVAAFPNSMPNP